MTRKMSIQGFSTVMIIVVLVVMTAIGFGGWQVWQNRDKKQSNNSHSADDSSNIEPEELDMSTASASQYLVIDEWGTRLALPESMRGKITYSMGESFLDSDGNNIQGLDILLATEFLTDDNFCETKNTAIGAAIDSGAQYIRSEKAKPFDSKRYKGNFKENIFSDTQYNYHLNHVTPDCVGGEENAGNIQDLQQVLTHLGKD